MQTNEDHTWHEIVSTINNFYLYSSKSGLWTFYFLYVYQIVKVIYIFMYVMNLFEHLYSEILCIFVVLRWFIQYRHVNLFAIFHVYTTLQFDCIYIDNIIIIMWRKTQLSCWTLPFQTIRPILIQTLKSRRNFRKTSISLQLRPNLKYVCFPSLDPGFHRCVGQKFFFSSCRKLDKWIVIRRRRGGVNLLIKSYIF